jgi:hypothetical protein
MWWRDVRSEGSNEVMIRDTPIAATGIDCFSVEVTMVLLLIVHVYGIDWDGRKEIRLNRFAYGSRTRDMCSRARESLISLSSSSVPYFCPEFSWYTMPEQSCIWSRSDPPINGEPVRYIHGRLMKTQESRRSRKTYQTLQGL